MKRSGKGQEIGSVQKTERKAEKQGTCESKQWGDAEKQNPKPKKQNRKRTKYNTQKEMLLVHEFENENVFIEVGRIILRFFT